MTHLTAPDAAYRKELTKAFNACVLDPRSYVYLGYKTKNIERVEIDFNVKISSQNVGHGALALTIFETGCYEALPFTLSGDRMSRLIDDDYEDDDPFVYGFHKYVARDVYSKFPEAEPSEMKFFDIWQTNGGALARLRALYDEQIEAIRVLSEQTPETTFLGRKDNDDAYLKIAQGAISSRMPRSSEWHVLTK